MSRPLLLGHRGARAVRSIPENSIASFDRCLADGCDGFEFDVRLSVDGQPLICHDPKFERSVIAQTQANRLAKLSTLEEVLKRYQATAFLDIELKIPGGERLTADLLDKYPPQRGFVVSSFLREVLQCLHGIDSAIPLGLICETKAQLRQWEQLSLYYVIAHQRLVTPELIEDVQRCGKKFLVWTVNSARDMRRLYEMGVDGIISDETSLLRRTLLEEDSGMEPK